MDSRLLFENLAVQIKRNMIFKRVENTLLLLTMKSM